MARHNELGRYGEDIAMYYLKEKGYEILERNWRFGKAEIDIIADYKDILIFVEVKTKSYVHFGQPEESVDAKKEALIMDAASEYMKKINYEWEIRFDIVSILVDKRGDIYLRHFNDAFFPSW